MEITSLEQFKKEAAAGKVLVDFYADWCGPCKMLAPIIEQIAEEHPELKVLKVNVDENGELASLYGIYSIPTLIYFENGEKVNQALGYQPKVKVLEFLGL